MKFFNDTDNFEKIIRSHFNDVLDVSQVKTGWTNYVFKIRTPQGTYYFRFPRNLYFANALVKEYAMVEFVKDKISYITPDLQLFYDNGRPYTLHAEIEGQSLSDCYESMTLNEKEILAQDISKLLLEFAKIDLTQCQNFQLVSNFLDNLAQVSQNNYDLSMHNKLKELENLNIIFSHGDFNPGNLILKNNRLSAVIDFAFAGVSNEVVDLSRIIGRCPEEFSKILIKEYEKTFNLSVNCENLKNLIEIWKYVEEKYILYIKQNHPSIILPTLV